MKYMAGIRDRAKTDNLSDRKPVIPFTAQAHRGPPGQQREIKQARQHG